MRRAAAAMLLAFFLAAPGAGAQSNPQGPPGPQRPQAKASLPSGSMSQRDFITHAVARSAHYAARRFDRIDSAHKGAVTRQEYIDYYKKRSGKLAARRFARIDSDHNGILEPSEIAAWRALHRRHPAAPAAK